MPGIEPGAFHMQSERATTALHPLTQCSLQFLQTSIIFNLLHVFWLIKRYRYISQVSFSCGGVEFTLPQTDQSFTYQNLYLEAYFIIATVLKNLVSKMFQEIHLEIVYLDR